MSHTLLLIQKTQKVSSRTFYDYDDEDKAAEGIIQMFEDYLKNTNKTSQITYVEDDVYNYIDAWADLVALVRQPFPNGQFAYAPKDPAWLKQCIRHVLLKKAGQLVPPPAAAYAAPGGHSLASRMQPHVAPARTTKPPAGNSHIIAVANPAAVPKGTPKTELMTKSFADRHKVDLDRLERDRDRPYGPSSGNGKQHHPNAGPAHVGAGGQGAGKKRRGGKR
ncbi:hypothetical protein AMAG_03689 [Allomyces macrogynus ATCC 38327]|uniref:Uncharacterized protein n=1 Tax=Allomyces macrogynus (strain ATCC 38327) TaxID=578462 RepID=A0A0L0SA96_ALLM3|nr:hypothetical protein AMAG_03689 [Allomyces macrogynus ATCC 38327]|eukprot:KNE59406.1 hypothetical protein AMAG_03689 [Allomyces macrogynus ATCC 38327]